MTLEQKMYCVPHMKNKIEQRKENWTKKWKLIKTPKWLIQYRSKLRRYFLLINVVVLKKIVLKNEINIHAIVYSGNRWQLFESPVFLNLFILKTICFSLSVIYIIVKTIIVFYLHSVLFLILSFNSIYISSYTYE